MGKSIWEEDIMESEVNLPAREFFYTLDQVCQMLDVSQKYLIEKIIYFKGRSPGRPGARLPATNIAPPDESPVWRVGETDFKLWMRKKGIAFRDPVNIRKY